MSVFNIGFNILNCGSEEPICDETQFDIEDTGDFSGMMTELIELFNDFCAQNGFNSTKISYIELVYPMCYNQVHAEHTGVTGGDHEKVRHLVLPERITIPLQSGFQLVAERNTNPNYRNEIFIGVTDGNGVWWQDLAVVRNAYQIDGDKVVWKDDEFDVLVYSDMDNEDFTHDFTVGLYHD